MKRFAMLFAGILVIFALYSYFSNKGQQAGPAIEKASFQPHKPPVTPPISTPQETFDAPQSVDPEITDQETDPETQEFLELLTQSPSLEQVYETPGNHVIVNRIDGYWVGQGDLLIDEKKLIENIGDSEISVVKLDKTRLWKNNRIPYVIDSALNPESVLKAIAAMNQQTNVRFVEHRGEADFVHFRSIDKQLCLSYVGRKGGEQEILINPNVCSFGNILHEMMHAVGFVHEHSRTDRDDFLIVHWKEIQKEAHNQFQKLTSEISQMYLGPFDFDSILLYPSVAFSVGENPTLTKKEGVQFEVNRSQLSKGDIAKINKLYKSPINEN